MEYQCSPFRQKQNKFQFSKSPSGRFYAHKQPSIRQKQNLELKRSHLNKNNDLSQKYQNTTFDVKSKHTTSQMVTDFENGIRQKEQKSFSQHYNELGDMNKSTFVDNRKMNAKHLQIESKINKIKSYHHKIQTLLEMVNNRPLTPSKISQQSFSMTSRNTNNKSHSITPSRSKSKTSASIIKENILTINLDQEFNQKKYIQQARQQSLEYLASGYSNRKQYQNKYQQNSNKDRKGHQLSGNIRNIPKFKDSSNNLCSQQYQCRISVANRKQITAANRRQLQHNKKFEESDRKKSKQYMKSIQGQVKNIQTAIELLNDKIKEVDNFKFKKEIVFDNLSASNPESFSQIEQKLVHEANGIIYSKNIHRNYKQSKQESNHPEKNKKQHSNDRNQSSKIKNQFQVDFKNKYQKNNCQDLGQSEWTNKYTLVSQVGKRNNKFGPI